VDKTWILEELKRFRKHKAEEHEFLSLVYEMREKLSEADLKNLSKTMKAALSFADVVMTSGNIIDSVAKNAAKTAQEKQNDMIKLVADLLIENCKLRKVSNDYAEAINHGTVEKLDKIKKVWPQGPKTVKKGDPISDNHVSIWNHFDLFDFFSGWQDS